MTRAAKKPQTQPFVPDPLSRDGDVQVAQAWQAGLPDLPSQAIPLFALLDVLSSLTIRFHRRILADTGHNHSDYAILATLLLNGAPMRPTIFTRMLSNASAATSQTLNKLEKQGLLKRSSSREDKRSVLVSLTAEGKKVALKLCEIEAEETARACKEVDDAEMESLKIAMRNIVGILKNSVN
jgi:DNA-binding MarR family transcriptional regulator